MRRQTILLIDALLTIGLLLVAGIAITGGGALTVLGTRLSLRSVGNGLFVLSLLGAARHWFGGEIPFLRKRDWTPTALAARAHKAVTLATGWLRSHRSSRLLFTLFVASVSLRLVNAAIHPGFFSGDDVEIHEMTFAVLQRADWTAWDLRSPFYPLGFILPVQFVAWRFGLTDPAALVFVGRCVGAIGSPLVIVLVYRIARSTVGRDGAALAALICATSALLVTFGSTELPRPISVLFVLTAYLMLCQTGGRHALVAGAAIAVAAAMRFSEAVFIVPALLQLGIERRWRTAGLFLLAAATVGLSIQMAVDYAYWGSAFASARAIVDYTLVRGLSSRGYQAPWFYFTHITDWTNYVVFGLALYGIRSQTWRWTVWAGTPIVLLSLLPHKEARYLIPAFPFVALLASAGLRRLLSRIASADSANAARLAAALVAALTGGLLFEVNGMHVRRSDGAVRLARSMHENGLLRQADVVLIEQAWRLGGRVYLGYAPKIVEVDADQLMSPSDLGRTVNELKASFVFVSLETCQRLDCAKTLEDRAFVRFTSPLTEADAGYVGLRSRPP